MITTAHEDCRACQWLGREARRTGVVHGTSAWMSGDGSHAAWWTDDGSPADYQCCAGCRNELWDEALTQTGSLMEALRAAPSIMHVCRDCGDKRCPRAADHLAPCQHTTEGA